MSAVPIPTEPVARLLPDPWTLLDRLPDAVLVVERDGPVLWINTAGEELFGLGRSTIVGRPLSELLGRGSALEALCRATGPGAQSVRERELRLEGRPPMRRGVYDARVSRDGPGGSVLTLSLRARGIGRWKDNPPHNRGASRSLSGFAAAVAHEIRNPLSGIRGAAQLLETAVGDDDRDLARLIADEVDRICALLERMEAFSERHPMAREALNIHEVLDRVARLGRAGGAAGLVLNEVYDPSLPAVDGNRDALIQVFLNLVRNAAEACGPGGVITLGTAYDGNIRRDSTGHRPLVVTVADDGPGVPPDLIDTLFEPFVSGSETRSGLGLSLVSRIVDDHGGVVTVDSVPGRTEFKVAFPFAGREAEP